MRTLFVYAMAS